MIQLLCLIGVLVCLYGIYIEKNVKTPKFRAICDINNNTSCTLVLTSKYSHMIKLLFNLNDSSRLNLSNAQYGLLFYIGLILYQYYPFTLLPFYNFLFFCIIFSSFVACIVLAYILYYKLQQLCLICVAIYIINTALFIIAVINLIL